MHISADVHTSDLGRCPIETIDTQTDESKRGSICSRRPCVWDRWTRARVTHFDLFRFVGKNTSRSFIRVVQKRSQFIQRECKSADSMQTDI